MATFAAEYQVCSNSERLDMMFYTDEILRASLDDDYELRNEAAHNYKLLPREARDVSSWLGKLESLVDKF